MDELSVLAWATFNGHPEIVEILYKKVDFTQRWKTTFVVAEAFLQKKGYTKELDCLLKHLLVEKFNFEQIKEAIDVHLGCLIAKYEPDFVVACSKKDLLPKLHYVYFSLKKLPEIQLMLKCGIEVIPTGESFNDLIEKSPSEILETLTVIFDQVYTAEKWKTHQSFSRFVKKFFYRFEVKFCKRFCRLLFSKGVTIENIGDCFSKEGVRMNFSQIQFLEQQGMPLYWLKHCFDVSLKWSLKRNDTTTVRYLLKNQKSIGGLLDEYKVVKRAFLASRECLLTVERFFRLKTHAKKLFLKFLSLEYYRKEILENLVYVLRKYFNPEKTTSAILNTEFVFSEYRSVRIRYCNGFPFPATVLDVTVRLFKENLLDIGKLNGYYVNSELREILRGQGVTFCEEYPFVFLTPERQEDVKRLREAGYFSIPYFFSPDLVEKKSYHTKLFLLQEEEYQFDLQMILETLPKVKSRYAQQSSDSE